MSAHGMREGMNACNAYFRNDGTYEQILANREARKAQERAERAESKVAEQ